MRDHDRFERLAGAVALGEASAEERAALDLHARDCDACRADVSNGALVASTIAAARDDETWRPSLEHVVAGRIRDARARRSTFAVGALGWAVAVSIALNVAFASGFAGRLESAFRETGEPQSSVAATRLNLGERAASASVSLEVRRAPATVARPKHRIARAPHPTVRPHAMAAPVRRSGGPSEDANAVANATAAEPAPDVLAGLDVDRPASGARTVAVRPRDACDPATRALADAPCDDENFSAHR